MKKLLGILFVFFAGMLISCAQIEDKTVNFSNSPVLTLSWDQSELKFVYSFEHSEPRADYYDVYWRTGRRSLNEILGGTKIGKSSRNGTIETPSQITIVSVVVAANKGGYSKAYSEVRQAEKDTGPPIDPPYTPSVVQAKSAKRGVGYNFTTLNKNNTNNGTHAARDIDLLMSGTSGICWFYNWGSNPIPVVETAARSRNLEFCPMIWGGGAINEENYRTFAQNNPQTEYILTYNEPNFYSQANLTPAQAADLWPTLKSLANELNLKIVSPAMNFGPMMGPVQWLDQFFAQPGVSLNDVSAIAVHTYPWYPSAVKGLLDDYRKYNKKLWLTEFCGWEDLGGRTPSYELQAWYMSMIILYLEMDPLVERYAWYLPKGHVAANAPPIGPPPKYDVNPFHNLLTEVNITTNPQLTDLGLIYVNIPSLDRSVWYAAGEKIDASQIMNCNLADCIGISGSWSDTVLFRPVTDTDKSAGVLEIHEFKNNMWVEYQVEAPESRVFNLSMRYKAPPLNNGTPNANNTMRIYVDGTLVTSAGQIAANGNLVLPTTDWTTAANIPLNLSAGQRTIRLFVTGANSNFALNWLMLE